jgi:hypothetical protein
MNDPTVCLQCETHFFLNGDTCTPIPSQTKVVDLFVKEYESGSPTSGSMDDPFFLLQQALNFVFNEMGSH